MSRRLQRLASFILAMILTLSSTNIALADRPNVNNKQGTASSSGSVSDGSTDGISTGYKVELMFLELSNETYENKNKEGGENLVIEEWNNARLSENDQQGTGNIVQIIGNPVYITTQHNKDAAEATLTGRYVATKAFKEGDFDYGLGTRTGNTGVDRDFPSTINSGADIMDTVETVSSTMTSLSLSDSNLNAYMSMSQYLPIFIGGAQQNIDTKLLNYFMVARDDVEGADEATEENGDYLPTTSYISLINYIATEKGKHPDDAIYFNSVAVLKGTTYVAAEPEIPSGATNIYDSGIYNGMYGEYRLIITPVWIVKSTDLGGIAALTARDMVWVADNIDGYDKGSIIYNQGDYFKDLCTTTVLSRNDIFGLTAPTSWPSSVSKYATAIRDEKVGGGIGIFTSEMVLSEIPTQETYIGSVSHIFLPGSLSDSQTEIKTASMEYLGPKADETGTSNAMTDAATNIGRALAGVEVNSDTFGTEKVTQDLILNGTIKIPGISSSSSTAGSYQTTNAYAANNQSELIKALEAALDEYTDDESAVRDGIIEVIKEYLGIDLSAPISTTSNTINMQDLNLVIYCLAHYQQDGLEATSGDTNAAYSNGANRWKQILAYQAMLENEASSEYIQESKGWVGPLSITWDDIANLSDSKVKGIFESYPLGKTADEINALSSTYSQTASDAKKAIDNEVLDNVDKGQISTTSDSSTGELTTWSEMADAEELDNGLVRKPVAMGNTQFYLGSGTDADESINVPKGYIGRATSDVLKGAVEDYLETKSQNGLNGFDHINLATGLEYLWGSTTVQTDGIYNSDLVETSLLVDKNVDFNEAGRNV